MRNIGSVSQHPELKAIVDAILSKTQTAFQSPTSGKEIQVKLFHSKGLYYVDHEGIRYVEQNPRTNSAYAKRAQQGAKIIWVIRLRDNAYLGCIEDGTVFMKPAAQGAS